MGPKLGDKMKVNPSLTGLADWVEGQVIDVEHNPSITCATCAQHVLDMCPSAVMRAHNSCWAINESIYLNDFS